MEEVFDKAMNKIIGLLTAWGAEDWIRPAIEQALTYCDEVMVVIAAYSPEFMTFEDSTYDICREYNRIKLLDYKINKAVHYLQIRADVMNLMLDNSSLYEPGNWIWILDTDEFYTDLAHDEIRKAIKTQKYDDIVVEEKFFVINMQHYLIGSHGRLRKITAARGRFRYANGWTQPLQSKYIVPRDKGMFHYSMLTNVAQHYVRWQLSHPGDVRAEWLKRIYANYDLENEDYWIEKSRLLTGLKSCWFNKGMFSDKDGRVFKYEGVHPSFIEATGLTKVS